MQIRIQQSGDDVALLIPRSIADAARLRPGDVVEASVQDNKLVVVPASRPTFALEELWDGVTEQNRHDEVSMGPPVGEEVW